MDSLQGKLTVPDWLPLLGQWGANIAAAVLILVIGIRVARWLLRLFDRAFARMGADQILATFLHNVIYGGLLVVIVLAALDRLGVPMTSLFAVVGAAGLAIGLALRDSLANIASGVMLITLRPFRAGDYVNIAGIDGTVEHVGVFQSALRTVENHVVVLPNGQITGVPIVNYTAKPIRRIDVPVGVAYDSDIRTARAVLLTVAKAHPKVRAEPCSDVLVTALADNSVNLVLRAWVDTPDYVSTRSDLIEAVHRELTAASIGIPFPQREVHLRLPDGICLRATDTRS